MIAALGFVFPVFALMLIGWAVGRFDVLPAEAVTHLNAFTVRLALPTLLFQFVAEAAWRTLWQPAFAAAFAGGIAVVFTTTILAGRPNHRLTDRTIRGLGAAYANTAFMGIPIAQALFGAAGLAAAVIASLLTVTVLFAISILLLELDRNGAGSSTAAWRGALSAVARNPLVVGPVAGGLWTLTGIALPEPVRRLTSALGATASPVALVTIGLFLAHAPARDAGTRAGTLCLAKIVAQPLATAAFVILLRVPAPWGPLAILISAMPTGTGPFMLAKLYDHDAVTTARVILITTLLSALTIPLLVLLLR
jgi:predicted permease